MNHFEIVTDPDSGEKYVPLGVRGLAIKNDPVLNKGTAFTERERDELGLRGLLPPDVSNMQDQLERAYGGFKANRDDLDRYLFLTSVQDRNETLFYRLLLEHLEEMLPIVYTPTVGVACEKFSHIYRRAHGLYVTFNDLDRMEQILDTSPYDNVAVLVVTDGEAILGIGDQGVGGLSISIGKLSLYTVGAGIHPTRCLPVVLDMGTDNPELRSDPLYLGVRRPRLRGEAYFNALDAFVDAVGKKFPGALLQWEDLSRQNAWSVLQRYRDKICSFNDDIQGTGAVTLSGLLNAGRITGESLKDQRFCVYGAGASGAGISYTIQVTLQGMGLSHAEALSRIVALDSRGLILADRPGLAAFKKPFAADPALVSGWKVKDPARINLDEVVSNFKPTVLVGTSGQPGAFTREMLQEMASYTKRPIILALSNPTSKTEVHPREALEWTGGKALIATGSPFAPVQHEGHSHRVAQCNNMLCFPGIGLGVLASGAQRVNDEMILAAAQAVSDAVTDRDLSQGCLFGEIGRVREISKSVAQAVGEAALRTGAIPKKKAEGLTPKKLAARVEQEMWHPEYLPYRYREERPPEHRKKGSRRKGR